MKKIILGIFLLYALKTSVFAFTGTWNVTGGGNWNDGANWDINPFFPNAVSDVAVLQTITNNSAITLGQDITIGTLTFNSIFWFTINSGNLLIFDNGGTAVINTNNVGDNYINCDVQLNNPLQLLNTSTGFLYLNGAISELGGSNGITQFQGTVYVTGSTPNTYTGVTSIPGVGAVLYLQKDANVTAIAGTLAIDNGTVHAGAANQFGATSVLTVNAGSFQLHSFDQAVKTLQGVGGTIELDSATLTVSDGTYSGIINGVGGKLNKTSGGTLTLSGVNTYSGGTEINGGTVSIAADNNLGDALGPISFNGGTLSISGFFTSNRDITLNASGGTIDISNPLILAGIITGAGSLTKTGAGNLIISNPANNYSGSTIITAGSIQAGNVNIMPESSLVLNGGTFDLNGFNQTIKGLSGTSLLFLFGPTLTVAGGGSYSGEISGNGVLSKTTSATLTISGPNTFFSGNTILNAGILQIGADNTLGTGTIEFNGGTLTSSGSHSLSNNITLNDQGIIDTTTGDISLSTMISGGLGLTKIGTGTLFLTNGLNFPGGVLLTAGTLEIGNSGALGAGFLNFQGGTLSVSTSLILGNNISFDQTGIFDIGTSKELALFGTIIGINGFIKTGNGNLVLAIGANNYSGPTIINAGTVSAFAANIMSSSSLVLNGGIFDLNGNNQIINGLSGTSNVLLGTATLTVAGGGSYSGVISGTGALTKTTSATLNLSGASDYSGGTAINAGTVGIIADNNLGTGDISFNGGTLTSSAAISTSKAVTLNASGGTFNITSDSLTLDASIGGTGSLTKIGSGTLILSGIDKTYSGDTIINNGISIFNSNISSSAVTVTNAQIKGNFTAKSLTANLGSFVRPGNSIGTIYVTDLILNAGSIYEVEINQTSSDRIIASNSATINNGAILEVLPLTNLRSGFQYYIILAGNPVSGTFTNVIFDNPSVTGRLFYNLGGNNVVLELTAGSLEVSVAAGNAGAVAAYLDTLSPPPGSDLGNIIDILAVLPENQMNEALDQMQPAIFKGFALSQHNILNIRKIIQGKSNEFYQNCCIRNVCKKKISVWASPYGSLLSQQDYQRGAFDYVGFDTDSAGIVIGSDFKVDKNKYLGISGAYSNSDIKWHDKRGKGDINSFYGNVYSIYHTNRFFINSSLFGAYSNFKGHRNIQFSSINRIAKNKHSGGEFLAHLDTGYIYHVVNSFELRSFVSGDYLYLKESSFTEKGAGSLNLHVRKSSYNTYRVEGGIYADTCFIYYKNKKIMPEIKLSYIREVNSRGKYYTCNLVNEPGSFRAKGPRPKRDIFSYGVNLTALFYNDLGKISFKYDGEAAKNYSNNVFFLELATQF